MSTWESFVAKRLEDRSDRDLLRELRAVEFVSATKVRRDGELLHLFSSNDYLGLSSHPSVCAAAAAAAREGMGPRGSALVCGYTTEHEALERDIAALKGAERALLTPTGYAANVGAMAALAGEGCAIFSDELNHASIIDGIGLARRRGASLHVYRHRDAEHLAELMGASDAPRKLIVTDGVFSMDGDLAPLPELVALREEHGALLVVDDAHGTLVMGEHGGGTSEHFGCEGSVDLHIGTLSKAAGAQGGFLAGSAKMVELLLNEARTFVFSTALPLPVVAAARAAIAVAADEPELRERVFGHVDLVTSTLGIESSSPIVPLVVGDPDEAVALSDTLLENGFHIPAIRPPTVPAGTSRLRIALSASHDEVDVLALCDALYEFGLG